MSDRNQDTFKEALAIQTEASAKGFDWVDVTDVIKKVHEEIWEIEEALSRNDKEAAKHELGDLLFAVVNLSRFLGADPGAALRHAATKFSRRFALLEKNIRKENRSINTCSVEELDAVWERVKIMLDASEKNGLT